MKQYTMQWSSGRLELFFAKSDRAAKMIATSYMNPGTSLSLYEGKFERYIGSKKMGNTKLLNSASCWKV